MLGTGNKTDLRAAFTESVNITFLASPLQPVSVEQKTNFRPCYPQMSNPLTSQLTAWSDGSGRWDNWMAAQALLQDLAQPSSGLKELSQTMKKTSSTFWWHVAHYFLPGKTLIGLHFQFFGHCNSHLVARCATYGPWTICSPQEHIHGLYIVYVE